MTTSQRGYGTSHQQRRRILLPRAIGTLCSLCDQPMLVTQPLDLDHTNPLIHNPRSIGDRIVHAHCNRGRPQVGGGQPIVKLNPPLLTHAACSNFYGPNFSAD
jgi:5-methylcytosine-specific restriction endonuclease McrA